MALRSGHGTGAGVPRVEVLPVDELPDGVRAEMHADARGERTPDGRWLPGARTVQSAGGRAKRGKSRLTARLGLSTLAEGDAFRPYRAAAATFRRVQCGELARTVGGGVCGPGPSSVVASAALALAWSRYLSDQAAATGDPELAMRSARLGETSRQHLLASIELCAGRAPEPLWRAAPGSSRAAGRRTPTVRTVQDRRGSFYLPVLTREWGDPNGN